MEKYPSGWMVSLWGLAALMQSQALDPAIRRNFEVASIKVNKLGGGPYMEVSPGRLMMTYYSVGELLAAAYGLRTDQIIGESPKERYDIEAKTDAKTPAEQMTGRMLQTLLEERFQLRLHRERRRVRVYKLTVAKSGPKMALTKEGSCVSATGGSGLPAFFCDHPRTGAKGLKRTLQGKGISMDALAAALSRTELNRTVLNATGLKGSFDVNLERAVDPSLPGLNDNQGGTPVSDAGLEEPSIFVALREQLGLKCDTGLAPVEVLVVDRATRPSQN